MNKELFVESIEALRLQYEHDAKCTELLSKVFESTHMNGYDNHYANNQLLKILCVGMKDSTPHSWIEYFCFEINFGKEYYEGIATEKDGTHIDISTSEKLYDYLIAHPTP